MTVTPIRQTRTGDVPPGCVDGYCVPCKREVIAQESDPRCEDCNTPLHPASLPARVVRQQAQNATQAGQPEPKTTDTSLEPPRAVAPQNRPARLRQTPEARAWDRATDAWLAALEREQRETEAAYREAKSRYEAARQEAHKLRQLRDLIVVDDAPAPASDGKRWARKYDACVVCETTETRHNSKGRCVTCQNYWQRNGRERPVNKETPDGD